MSREGVLIWYLYALLRPSGGNWWIHFQVERSPGMSVLAVSVNRFAAVGIFAFERKYTMLCCVV